MKLLESHKSTVKDQLRTTNATNIARSSQINVLYFRKLWRLKVIVTLRDLLSLRDDHSHLIVTWRSVQHEEDVWWWRNTQYNIIRACYNIDLKLDFAEKIVHELDETLHKDATNCRLKSKHEKLNIVRRISMMSVVVANVSSSTYDKFIILIIREIFLKYQDVLTCSHELQLKHFDFKHKLYRKMRLVHFEMTLSFHQNINNNFQEQANNNEN